METNMSEISRAVLFGKLDTLLFTSLESATAFCKLRGNPYVELVHWLHQLMQQQDGDLQQVIRHFALDEQQLTRDIVAALDVLPRGRVPFPISPSISTAPWSAPGSSAR
jgi:type VI secretion system protein VasG